MAKNELCQFVINVPSENVCHRGAGPDGISVRVASGFQCVKDGWRDGIESLSLAGITRNGELALLTSFNRGLYCAAHAATNVLTATIGLHSPDIAARIGLKEKNERTDRIDSRIRY